MATVSSAPRTTAFTTVSTTAGPFNIPWRLFDTDSLDVYLNGVRTTAFTVSATFANGFTDSATLTLTTAVASGTQIIIDGALTPRRDANYLPSDPALTTKMNIELARLWSGLAEVKRDSERAMRGLVPIEPSAEITVALSPDAVAAAVAAQASAVEGSVIAFGAVGNGTTDCTAAFQAALDSGLRVVIPAGEYLITDTLLLPYGASLVGAGGVALYDDAKTRIRFEPATKRDLFNWRTAPTGYVFEGVTLKGFCVRGFGPGAANVINLPRLYNGEIDCYGYAGIDTFIRFDKAMDSRAAGGVQGFRTSGVIFANSAGGSGDVSTTIYCNLYVSQGPTGYQFDNYGASGVQIRGVVESVDCVFNQARGNVVSAEIYTENAPRTDAGAAFLVGKTGAAPAFATSLLLTLLPGIGWTGGTAANCLLIDADATRFVRVRGYAYSYGALLATTANTERVSLTDLDTDNTPWLSLAGGIADMSRITATGFRPRNMQTRGDSFFSEYNLAGPDLELFQRDRATITRRKLFTDAWTRKLMRRDAVGNFSQPIGYLETTATSGWTFNGANLVPGELVVHTTEATGNVALWQSLRHSKDTANSFGSCSTTAGSAVITRSGLFFPFEVGDWVTVSAGYGSATAQRRIVARAADYSTITLDTAATSTVSGTVTVATEVHQLVPIGQKGARQLGASPVGVTTPAYLGEEVFVTATAHWFKSTGLTSADWKQTT